MKFQEATGKTILDAFLEFHAMNPRVYELFKRFTFEAINAGKKNSSSKLIINRLRWEYYIETTDPNSDFKINDAFTAYYARLFHIEFPEHDGFFHMRALRSK